VSRTEGRKSTNGGGVTLLATAVMTLAVASTAGWMILLVLRTFGWSWFRSNRSGAFLLCWDGALSLLFFVQHSGMIRARFRDYMGKYVSPHLHGAVYAIASGLAFAVVLLLWQPSTTRLLILTGAALWIARSCTVLAAGTFLWSLWTLRTFDPLGFRPIKAHLRGAASDGPPEMVVRGPYLHVRHPLYACILVALWAHHELTSDRLLLDVLWTAWIHLAARLEEADLVRQFGDTYRAYQREVPMFFPLRARARKGCELREAVAVQAGRPLQADSSEAKDAQGQTPS
jgi:methanethiol S-methyltransferase